MCLFDSDWFLISEMAFVVFELLPSRSGVLFQWMESLVFLLILWFLFCFLQSYSGFTQKWIIILQEFYVIDMKHTLKVMTIKKSGWPKSSSYINILMNKNNWTSNSSSSEPAATEELPLGRLHEPFQGVKEKLHTFTSYDWHEATCLVFLLFFFDKQHSVPSSVAKSAGKRWCRDKKKSSPDSFHFSSFWPNPYLSQSVTKGSRVSFHFSFLLYCSWWCIDLPPCRYKND